MDIELVRPNRNRIERSIDPTNASSSRGGRRQLAFAFLVPVSSFRGVGSSILPCRPPTAQVQKSISRAPNPSSLHKTKFSGRGDRSSSLNQTFPVPPPSDSKHSSASRFIYLQLRTSTSPLIDVLFFVEFRLGLKRHTELEVVH